MDGETFDERVVRLILAARGIPADAESVLELRIALRQEFHGARPYIGSPERLKKKLGLGRAISWGLSVREACEAAGVGRSWGFVLAGRRWGR
jgi:hypothetical protein